MWPHRVRQRAPDPTCSRPDAPQPEGVVMAGEMGPEEALDALAHGDAPVLETLGQMHLDTLERSQLPEHTYHLVRLAALVAMDAAPVSYLVNLGAAHEAGVDARDVQGVLT